jgi:hypothetical protein
MAFMRKADIAFDEEPLQEQRKRKNSHLRAGAVSVVVIDQYLRDEWD